MLEECGPETCEEMQGLVARSTRSVLVELLDLSKIPVFIGTLEM